jgi:CubicO group peptidase (beta-lactamase class C family)
MWLVAIGPRWWWVALVLSSLCGCGEAGSAGSGASTSGSGGQGATGGGGGVGGADPWSAVRETVLAAADEENVDLALVVWDAEDNQRFEVTRGAFTPDTRVAVASASKHIAGLVIFDVIRIGDLSLSSTTGDVLGWTGDGAAITLEQLLSFTSGLAPEAACTLDDSVTLAECVDEIGDGTLAAPPGTRFEYGSSHLHVAGRMAEVATGKTWKELFDDTLRLPFGLPPDVAYFTFPRQALGETNPLVAGGLRASMVEYAPMLQLSFHRGTLGEVSVGTAELFEAQAKEPFEVDIEYSPLEALGFHYGLTAWLECMTPATGCEVLSSPGAFGFTPWFDRETGYVAILGMELGIMDVDEGAATFSVTLEQQLKPLIRAALTP